MAYFNGKWLPLTPNGAVPGLNGVPDALKGHTP